MAMVILASRSGSSSMARNFPLRTSVRGVRLRAFHQVVGPPARGVEAAESAQDRGGSREAGRRFDLRLAHAVVRADGAADAGAVGRVHRTAVAVRRDATQRVAAVRHARIGAERAVDQVYAELDLRWR